jgi:hypothetical protein
VTDSRQTPQTTDVPVSDEHHRFQCDGCGHMIVTLSGCAPYELIAWMFDGTGKTLRSYCSLECADQ